MTIIIETPQPPIRERLILVLERQGPGPNERDAEPADLERAGWVRDSDLLALTVRAEAAEAERDEARDTIARARGCITDVPAGVRNALDIEVARLLRDLDEARAERDEVRLILDASAGETTADAATRLHNDWVDARERADRVERERAVDAISGRARAAIVERDEARAALATMTRQRDDALQVLGHAREALPSDMRDGWLVDAVRRVVRERDEARQRVAYAYDALKAHDNYGSESLEVCIREVLQVIRERGQAIDRVVEERDEAMCAVHRAEEIARAGGENAERARCVAWLRAEAASSDWASCATWGRALSDTADRLERGEHADTSVPAAEPRATDEELVGLFDAAASRRAAVAAVAARVRREQPAHAELDAAWAAAQVPVRGLTTLADVITTLRERPAVCLVTRAVEAGLDVAIVEAHDDAERPGLRYIVRITESGGEETEATVPAADVPATLARLLGEVTRGQ